MPMYRAYVLDERGQTKLASHTIAQADTSVKCQSFHHRRLKPGDASHVVGALLARAALMSVPNCIDIIRPVICLAE